MQQVRLFDNVFYKELTTIQNVYEPIIVMLTFGVIVAGITGLYSLDINNSNNANCLKIMQQSKIIDAVI